MLSILKNPELIYSNVQGTFHLPDKAEVNNASQHTTYRWKIHWHLPEKKRKKIIFLIQGIHSASPSKQVTPSPHEAVHQDAGDAGRDGGDLDPTVSLHIDVVHRLPRLLAVHREDDAAAVGGQCGGVQVSQVGCAYSKKVLLT